MSIRPSIVADHLAAIRPSATVAMTAMAIKLREQGRAVITLSQGEPDFDTPEAVQQAGIDAIRAGRTRYTAVPGVTPLRQAIVDKLDRDNGLTYGVDQVVVGVGAKQVIFNALFASLNPGDEVVIPTPCWVSYPDMVRLCGGVPVTVDCAEADGFILDPEALEAAITPRTRWLMLNSPSNPTGAVHSAADLEAIAAVLRRHPQVWVMADDIYEKLVFAPAEFATIGQVAPDLMDRTLTVNGVSKANCMTGWRVGYGAGPLELIAAMITIQGQTTSATSSISQHAAIEAIGGDQSYLVEQVAAFRARRDLMVGRLAAMPGLTCRTPDGAFYVYPGCADLIGARTPSGQVLQSDTDVALHLLEAAGVATVPGSGFLGSPHVRISYATATAELEQACDQISAALHELTIG